MIVPLSQRVAGEVIPPLEPGDSLTFEEFRRRYEAMPNAGKAELIEGIVYMPAAVRARLHGRPSNRLNVWLGEYEMETLGVEAYDNTTIRLDGANAPQPDVCLLISPECRGQATISDDDYVQRAPELVAEVSASSVSINLHSKLQVYLRSGVREYIVWRVLDKQIDWFILRSGAFEQLAPNGDGLLCSETFPGLWLDAAALVQGKMKRVLGALKQGLSSDEHAAFLAKLQAARDRG